MKKLENIAVFDTSYGTQNLGDFIIMDSINREMNYLFGKYFVTRYSTHTPIARFYQNFRKGMILRVLEVCKYKFIGGTNIFKNTIFRFNPDWNINIFNIKFYKGSIAIGCGSALNAKKMDLYTQFIYKKILSKKYIHSTRDERTKNMLENLGFKAINTGCATMWCLTKEHCKKIKQGKSNKVIFTLTDYLKDENSDQILIDILNKNYDEVYFWVQGAEDFEYFSKFKHIEKIIIVNPTLEDYSEVLEKNEIDYVGTRLHAGIYAMQHFCRTIIISIDERSRDINEKYNLNCIERDEISTKLSKKINSTFKTEINIDEEAIKLWKNQFK